MIVCMPLAADGSVGGGWGRAPRVALASVTADGVEDWQVHDVAWDVLHDTGTEGSHHARVARFLREHGVQVVVAGHMGEGMARMLGKLGIRTVLGATGDARTAALAAAAAPLG